MAKRLPRTVVIPTSLDEANTALREFGETERAIAQIEREYTEAVNRLRTEADARMNPLIEKTADLVIGLETYAKANRPTLLASGGKTVELSAGKFGWRFTPFKVVFGKVKLETLIASIKALGLGKHYIRTKETVDREALLRDRPEIPGVRYRQTEAFFVEAKPAVSAEEKSNVISLVA